VKDNSRQQFNCNRIGKVRALTIALFGPIKASMASAHKKEFSDAVSTTNNTLCQILDAVGLAGYFALAVSTAYPS
jgi:hypothetical protein